MKQIIVVALLFITVVFGAFPAWAGGKPIQLSLFSPVQIYAPERSITGLRLSLLYGKNVNVTGLDLRFRHADDRQPCGRTTSVVGKVDGNATGIQYGFVPWTKGTMTGLQCGFGTVSDHFEGCAARF